MNKGLPSLLDAIFGKQDLDSVTLEEMYELITEFPSFNAGHFLLSKKLKQQDELAYEKETMRTALYFNNPFWLQSVLNEDIYPEGKQVRDKENSNENGDPHQLPVEIETKTPNTGSEPSEENAEPSPTRFFMHEELVELSGLSAPTVEVPKDELDMDHSIREKQSSESLSVEVVNSREEFSSGHLDGPVTSFDDLILKYQIQPLEPVEEISADTQSDKQVKPDEENGLQEKTTDAGVTESENFAAGSGTFNHGESENFISDIQADSYEIHEEVINEYGIFEEVIVKKSDFDLEAFDRPHGITLAPAPETQDIIPTNEKADEGKYEEGTTVEIPKAIDDDSVPSPELPVKTDMGADYDSFDRPIDHNVQKAIQDEAEYNKEIRAEEESITEIYSGHESIMDSVAPLEEPDDTGSHVFSSDNDGRPEEAMMPGLAERYGEYKKAIPAFDPKKAESIVFAPYHMIDYFASQGIKLVMEENPADPFAKQLKSFTDWLKVMKKLPVQSISEKTDEKEVDRIRHFAAHSVDEREILTESMAEVLAKQGMYENAIALYQKLSLIYPPKSAYFASRIEQLKASLP